MPWNKRRWTWPPGGRGHGSSMDVEPATLKAQTDGSLEPEHCKGKIEFDKVCFHYATRRNLSCLATECALLFFYLLSLPWIWDIWGRPRCASAQERQLSSRFQPGKRFFFLAGHAAGWKKSADAMGDMPQVVALVGQSGSGKTSCVSLLQRLYDCQAQLPQSLGRWSCWQHIWPAREDFTDFTALCLRYPMLRSWHRLVLWKSMELTHLGLFGRWQSLRSLRRIDMQQVDIVDRSAFLRQLIDSSIFECTSCTSSQSGQQSSRAHRWFKLDRTWHVASLQLVASWPGERAENVFPPEKHGSRLSGHHHSTDSTDSDPGCRCSKAEKGFNFGS